MKFTCRKKKQWAQQSRYGNLRSELKRSGLSVSRPGTNESKGGGAAAAAATAAMAAAAAAAAAKSGFLLDGGSWI